MRSLRDVSRSRKPERYLNSIQSWHEIKVRHKRVPHLTERGAFVRQDDHHGDVVSAVRHLQQLHMVVGEVPVPEAGLLVHHADRAGATLADVEVWGIHVIFVELVLPLTLREDTRERQHPEQTKTMIQEGRPTPLNLLNGSWENYKFSYADDLLIYISGSLGTLSHVFNSFR